MSTLAAVADDLRSIAGVEFRRAVLELDARCSPRRVRGRVVSVSATGALAELELTTGDRHGSLLDVPLECVERWALAEHRRRVHLEAWRP